MKAGKAEEALAEYDKALAESCPTEPGVHFNRGTALYGLTRCEEAGQAFLRATEAKDARPEGGGLLQPGQRLLPGQKYEEAAQAYKKSLAYNPGDVQAKWNLELALQARRRTRTRRRRTRRRTRTERRQGQGQKDKDKQRGAEGRQEERQGQARTSRPDQQGQQDQNKDDKKDEQRPKQGPAAAAGQAAEPPKPPEPEARQQKPAAAAQASQKPEKQAKNQAQPGQQGQGAAQAPRRSGRDGSHPRQPRTQPQGARAGAGPPARPQPQAPRQGLVETHGASDECRSTTCATVVRQRSARRDPGPRHGAAWRSSLGAGCSPAAGRRGRAGRRRASSPRIDRQVNLGDVLILEVTLSITDGQVQSLQAARLPRLPGASARCPAGRPQIQMGGGQQPHPQHLHLALRAVAHPERAADHPGRPACGPTGATCAPFRSPSPCTRATCSRAARPRPRPGDAAAAQPGHRRACAAPARPSPICSARRAGGARARPGGEGSFVRGGGRQDQGLRRRAGGGASGCST